MLKPALSNEYAVMNAANNHLISVRRDWLQNIVMRSTE